MSARRLLLTTTGLEVLRRLVLPAPLDLPPGFRLAATADAAAQDAALQAARGPLAEAGALVDGQPHPAVAADLQVLSRPELAVSLRARRPGLEVTAFLALRGPLGVSLLRTSPTVVQLSAFPAAEVADELARVVPAPTGPQRLTDAATVPLDALLPGAPAGGPAGLLRSGSTGALHAAVLSADPPGTVGTVEWVFDGASWVGLEPRPSVDGRPQVRLVPVEPADLGRWLAPLAGTALSGARA